MPANTSIRLERLQRPHMDLDKVQIEEKYGPPDDVTTFGANPMIALERFLDLHLQVIPPP